MNTFELGSHKIYYAVKRTSRRGSVGIQVLSDTQVMFRVPKHFSGDLKNLLGKYADWILKEQNDFKNRVHPKETSRLPGEEALKQYDTEAAQKIRESLNQFQPLVGIHPKKVSIGNQKTRWGSCNRHHDLRFNWRLVLLPPAILDYVVVHELCHLIHLNHSKSFWKKVESILPDYKEKRRWLRENSIDYLRPK